MGMSVDATWVALLRGINVGGRNRVAMADLRAALESAGLERVRTHIQSGNVVFEAGADSADESTESMLAATIVTAVEAAAGVSVPVIVRGLVEIVDALAGHPDAASDVPPKWLHVWFLSDAAPTEDIGDVARFAPARLVVDGRVAYATYPDGVAGSKLTIDVVERALGVTATARNLSTLAAIVALGRAP